MDKQGHVLRSSVGQGLNRWHDLVSLSSADYNFDLFIFVRITISSHQTLPGANLDGSVIDKKAIQLLKSLAGAVSLVESDIGNAAADGIGAVDEIDSLDGSNGLDKVFLAKGACQCIDSRNSSVHLRESESGSVQHILVARRKPLLM